MESVQMRSFFWSVFSRIWTKYRDLWSKYGPEKTPYLDTFYTVSKVYKKMLKNTLLLRQEKKFVMELDFRSVTKKRLKKNTWKLYLREDPFSGKFRTFYSEVMNLISLT